MLRPSLCALLSTLALACGGASNFPPGGGSSAEVAGPIVDATAPEGDAAAGSPATGATRECTIDGEAGTPCESLAPGHGIKVECDGTAVPPSAFDCQTIGSADYSRDPNSPENSSTFCCADWLADASTILVDAGEPASYYEDGGF
jgi:hypothetical protein